MKKILLILLPLITFLGGSFAGGFMTSETKPDAHAKDDMGHDEQTENEAASEDGHTASHSDDHGQDSGKDTLSWYRFPSQFFIPLIRQGEVADIMVVTATIEMPKSAEEDIYRQEHRLRDAVLRQMLIHANSGGFDGNFTSEAHLNALRRELLAAAQQVAGKNIKAILIEDIVKQKP